MFLAVPSAVQAQFPDAPRAPMPPVSERRAAVLKAFDADHDGRLSEAERDAARRAWFKAQLSKRPDRGFFQPPPELMEEFDANRDGDLDHGEELKAMQTMGERIDRMRRDYDADASGDLGPAEVAAAIRDVDAGKLKGIPRMLVPFAAGRPGGGPGGMGGGPPQGPQMRLRAADRNQNGRLEADELEAVRKSRAAAARGSEAGPSEVAPRP